MDALVPFGRRLFAVAIIAFGVQQLLFGDFVPGRAPAWPAAMAGRLVWAYGTAVAFMACGIAMIVGRRARQAAMLVAVLIAGWALSRNIPVALQDTQFGGAWTNLGKALALTGGALAFAGSLTSDGWQTLLHAGRWCLGIFLFDSGIQHFLFPAFVVTLVPAWIPRPMFWTYFAAVALMAGGVGLVVPRTSRLAAALTGLMVGLWFVMLHVPRAIAAVPAQRRNEWTAVFEALAISGIAFILTRGDHGAR